MYYITHIPTQVNNDQGYKSDQSDWYNEKITKSNCNLYTEEHLIIIINIHDKCIIVMNKNLKIYGAFRNKTTFHQFFLSNDDSI